MQKLGELLASKGRYGDTMLAHISPDEAELLKAHGGSGTINPETGLPEFWKGWKAIRKVAKIAAPVLGTLLAPGIGSALGSTLSSATLGGVGGALGGGVGGAMGGGGVGGALKGAALGGVGGYLSSGGLTELAPETSNALYNSTGGLIGSSNGTSAGLGSLLGLSGSSSAPLGQAAGTTLDALTGTTGLQGATQGSGLSGLAGRLTSSVSDAAPSLLSGGGSSSFGGLGTALGAGYGLYSNDQAMNSLSEAEKRAQGLLAPYQATGQAANAQLADKLASGELGGTFNPGDLTEDPGYQFNLQQGQQALDRQQAAKGNFFSGAALKSAQDYGQGLADNTYNQAYQRWLQGQNNTYGMLSGTSNAGQQAAGGQADLTTTLGTAKAAAGLKTSDIINQSLASLLAGKGRYSQYA